MNIVEISPPEKQDLPLLTQAVLLGNKFFSWILIPILCNQQPPSLILLFSCNKHLDSASLSKNNIMAVAILLLL